MSRRPPFFDETENPYLIYARRGGDHVGGVVAGCLEFRPQVHDAGRSRRNVGDFHLQCFRQPLNGDAGRGCRRVFVGHRHTISAFPVAVVAVAAFPVAVAVVAVAAFLVAAMIVLAVAFGRPGDPDVDAIGNALVGWLDVEPGRSACIPLRDGHHGPERRRPRVTGPRLRRPMAIWSCSKTSA